MWWRFRMIYDRAQYWKSVIFVSMWQKLLLFFFFFCLLLLMFFLVSLLFLIKYQSLITFLIVAVVIIGRCLCCDCCRCRVVHWSGTVSEGVHNWWEGRAAAFIQRKQHRSASMHYQDSPLRRSVSVFEITITWIICSPKGLFCEQLEYEKYTASGMYLNPLNPDPWYWLIILHWPFIYFIYFI